MEEQLLSTSLFLLAWSGVSWLQWRHKRLSKQEPTSYEQLVGKTQMIKLTKLSHLLGCNILLKMECCNPAGTGKDRAVKHMLDVAEKQGILTPGMSIVEGTSGSTGIALAYQCNARGYSLQIVMPDDQAQEKKKLLEKLGATVTIVPCCAIANKNHYVNQARKLATDLRGFYVNQFENTTNADIHYLETGPEIWKQCNGEISAFIMSAGTGGTIAGVSRYLKEQNPSIQIILADPEGSSLFNKVQHNVCYTHQQSERKIRKHRYDSIVEGVGLDRVTKNFEQAIIDTAYQIPDQTLVTVAHWLLHHEGIFVGSSSALNIAATIKAIMSNEHWTSRGSTVVTVCCDYGNRHLSRFWNEEYLVEYGLHWPTKEEIEDIYHIMSNEYPNDIDSAIVYLHTYPDDIIHLEESLKQNPDIIKAAVNGAAELPSIRFQGERGDHIRYIAKKLNKKSIIICAIIGENPEDHDIRDE